MDKIVFTTQSELEDIILSCFRKYLTEKLDDVRSDKSDILNITEASSYLNLAKQTIYGFTSKNEIPFIKKGKKLYFKKSDLEKWLFKGKQLTREEIEASSLSKITSQKSNTRK